jgi:putative glutamine amidotransferase
MVQNMSMTKPLIGLSTYLTRGHMTTYDSLLACLPNQYVEGVTGSGGNAVLLPPQRLSPVDATELITRLDGLIISGGEDVNPKRYGQTPGPHTENPVDVRDDFEDALLAAALHAKLPILGICRGAQMLNVHLGGTLHQHLPDVVGHHRYQVGDGVFHPEEMSLEPGSRVAEIFGGTTTVGHVYHHQGIDRVAEKLTVTARGFDGIPQAVELEDYPFGLAVQWHPEENLSELALFSALVKAASA